MIRSLSREFVYRRTLAKIQANGFWMVDVPRTSSTSLRLALAYYYGDLYGKTNVIEQEMASKLSPLRAALCSKGLKDHTPARDLINIFGSRIWKELFTFSLTRNPYDRMVSLYLYRIKRNQLPMSLSFKSYISQLESPISNKRAQLYQLPAYYLSSCDFLMDERGHPAVNYIGKYEKRNEAIQVIGSRLGLQKLNTPLVQAASTKNVHYSEFYDNETQLLVGRAYARDLDYFDYTFEKDKNATAIFMND